MCVNNFCSTLKWCPGEDSNLHTLRHTDLNRARLPIPPPGHCVRLAYFQALFQAWFQSYFFVYFHFTALLPYCLCAIRYYVDHSEAVHYKRDSNFGKSPRTQHHEKQPYQAGKS